MSTTLNVNSVYLVGNVCNEPRVGKTREGHTVIRFTVAINRKWTTKAGEGRDESVFIDVEVFGNVADLVCGKLKKRASVFVEGRLRQTVGDNGEGRKPSLLVSAIKVGIIEDCREPVSKVEDEEAAQG